MWGEIMKTAEKKIEGPKKETFSKLTSKKKLIQPWFFYILFVVLLLVFGTTWFIHNHWKEPNEVHTHTNSMNILGTSEKKTPEKKKEDLALPAKNEKYPTLAILDQRLDRLEGLISESGSFEQDINTLKSSLSTINTKLDEIKVDEKKQINKSMLVILIVQAFNKARQALYSGTSWYTPLKKLYTHSFPLPENIALNLKELLEKLEEHQKKNISSPSSLHKEFLELLPSIKKDLLRAKEERDNESYWVRFKRTLRNLVNIKHINKKTSSMGASYLEQMENALKLQQISNALTIFRIKGDQYPSLKKWAKKAQDWVTLDTIINAGEETVLQTLLKQEV